MEKELATAIKKNIKKLVYILAILVMPGMCFAVDHVIISEVMYDPAGTETGGEAVELYNPTGSQIDISGHIIKTESSGVDATIPDGTSLDPHTFYLIADSGWSVSRDNASWPLADHEEAITMSNSDAGVALLYPNGTTIDAVGWGNPAGINEGLFEGTPAALASAGKSLKRADLETDNDDNSVDFSEAEPELQNSSTTSGGETDSTNSSQSITMGVKVENNAPTIDYVVISGDEDNSTAGVQIIPVPEGSKTVTITAEVTDLDGIAEVGSVTITATGPTGEKEAVITRIENISNTTARYNATVDMLFYEAAGTYDVAVTAQDIASNATGTTGFDYLSMAAISIDSSSLQFTGAKLGGTSEISGDFALSTTDSPTIRNIGNTQLDMGLYGTDLVDGTKNITIDNMKYSFDNDFEGSLAGTLGKTLQTKNIGLENSADSVISIGFRMFVPITTQNGNYTGQVTVVAISS